MNKEGAIKIVRSHYLANKQMLNEALEFLIPELKEDEDELTWLKNYISEEAYYLSMDIRDDVDRIKLQKLQKSVAWLEKQVTPEDKGEISDGYHTFNELYYYRMLYNAAFFNLLPKAWVHKSKKHHDGEECFGGGWFIVMANLPTGQISNHYELKDWELFQIPEKEVADEWDGHTPKEAAERLHKYLLRHKEKELLCAKCRKENPYYSCQELTEFGNCAVENVQANEDLPKSDERKDYISIPFGAFDSELIEETITIPDGCYAYIKGNKVYITKSEQKQDPCKDCDHPMLNCHYFPCITKKAFDEQNNLVTAK